MFYSEGQATSSKLLKQGYLVEHLKIEIVIQEVLWSTQEPYSAIWGLDLTNVKWHSDQWSVTDSPTDQTFHQFYYLVYRYWLSLNYE